MGILGSLLAALPAIEKLIAMIVKAIAQAEEKNQKDSFRKAIQNAILKGDQRELDGGRPSGLEGVEIVERQKDD